MRLCCAGLKTNPPLLWNTGTAGEGAARLVTGLSEELARSFPSAGAAVATEVTGKNEGLERVALVATCAGFANENCELNELNAGLTVGLGAGAAVRVFGVAETVLTPKVNPAAFPFVVKGAVAVAWASEASEDIVGGPNVNVFAETTACAAGADVFTVNGKPEDDFLFSSPEPNVNMVGVGADAFSSIVGGGCGVATTAWSALRLASDSGSWKVTVGLALGLRDGSEKRDNEHRGATERFSAY